MNSRPRAVVTGVGILAANGWGIQNFWETLLAGKTGIGPITLFDSSDLACHIAGEVKGFIPEEHIDPALKPKRMGRFTQFAVVGARMAIEDAGFSLEQIRKRDGLMVIIGVSTSAMDILAQPTHIHSAVAFIPNAATSAVSYMLNAQPRFLTISDGCDSSMESIAMAAEMVRSGKEEIVIAGGAESLMTHRSFESMLKCRRCSVRNDDPQGASRPFDRDRDYGVMSEGGAILVIENLEHALARGCTPYAEVVSSFSNADHATGEEGSGLRQCMQMALANSGHGAGDISYVSAHGPSDIQMDVLETRLIKDVLGDHAYTRPVISIKGATGCPAGAGGAMQAVAACLSFRDQVIPPTANFVEGGEGCDLDYVPRQARLARVERVLLNSHGFGRNNCCLVMRRDW